MRKYVFTLLLGVLVTAIGAAARADTIVGFTNRTTFGGNDSATWNQLGANLANIPNPFNASSIGTVPITGSFTGRGINQWLRVAHTRRREGK
jgi:hypothetical protein